MLIYSIAWPKAELTKRSGSFDLKTAHLNLAFRTYSSLELLSNSYNSCFAFLIIPFMKILAILGSTMSMFALIKYGHEIHIILRVILFCLLIFFVSILLLLCQLGSNLYEKTRHFRVNYGYVVAKLPILQQKEYQKRSDACAPFGFRVGSFYIIRNVTIISVMNILLNMTLFMLITY